MFKKLIVIVLIIALSSYFDVSKAIYKVSDTDPFFYLQRCEQVIWNGCIDDNFEDNSVAIVLDRITSRGGDRVFTADDFISDK